MAPKAKSAVDKAQWKAIRQLKRAPEMKMYDTAISGSIGLAPSGTLISPISQGTDDYNRVGNSITVRAIHASFLFTKSNAVAANSIRISIVRYAGCNGAAPLASQLFLTQPGAVTNGINTMRNTPEYPQFKVLWSRVFSMNSQSHDGTNFSADQKVVTAYVNRKFDVHFKSNLGTDAGMGKNALYLLYSSDSATNMPSIGGYVRVAFQDQ